MHGKDLHRLERMLRLTTGRWQAHDRLFANIFRDKDQPEVSEDFQRRLKEAPFVPRDHHVEMLLRQRARR